LVCHRCSISQSSSLSLSSVSLARQLLAAAPLLCSATSERWRSRRSVEDRATSPPSTAPAVASRAVPLTVGAARPPPPPPPPPELESPPLSSLPSLPPAPWYACDGPVCCRTSRLGTCSAGLHATDHRARQPASQSVRPSHPPKACFFAFTDGCHHTHTHSRGVGGEAHAPGRRRRG
jgi:hypothetical protein